MTHQSRSSSRFLWHEATRSIFTPPWMGCQSIAGLNPQYFAGTHLYTLVERGTVGVKCLAQEHNAMSPARPRTRTTRSGVEHTNHDATAPPILLLNPVEIAFKDCSDCNWGLLGLFVKGPAIWWTDAEIQSRAFWWAQRSSPRSGRPT